MIQKLAIQENQGIQNVLSSDILHSPSRCVLWSSKSPSLSPSLNLLIFLHFMVVRKVLATIMNYTFRLSWKSRNSSYIYESLPYTFTYGKQFRKNRGSGRFFLIAGVRPFMRILNTSRNRSIRRFKKDAQMVRLPRYL